MNTHWTDDDFDAFFCGDEIGPERLAHLKECLSCRKRVDDFSALVEGASRQIEAEMPEAGEQLESILVGIASLSTTQNHGRGRKWRALSGVQRSLLMAAATLLLILGGLSLRPAGRTRLAPTPRPDLQVEEILSTANALLADNSIPGFDGLGSLNEGELELVIDNNQS